MSLRFKALSGMLAIMALAFVTARMGVCAGLVGGFDSRNASFEIQPHVLSAEGPADTSNFVGGLVQDTAKRWLSLVPQEARAPQLKVGMVIIDFVLHPTGSVADLTLIRSSGDVALDRAAWSSISGCRGYPAFPANIKAAEVRLQFTFVYNGKIALTPAPVFK